MQTRIQLTITGEDKDKLFDKQHDILDMLALLPFDLKVSVYPFEPEEED